MENTAALTGGQIAKSGFDAEEMLTKQEDIKVSLEAYFEKPIKTITKMDCRPHPKKSDIKIEFDDGTSCSAQVKIPPPPPPRPRPRPRPRVQKRLVAGSPSTAVM